MTRDEVATLLPWHVEVHFGQCTKSLKTEMRAPKSELEACLYEVLDEEPNDADRVLDMSTGGLVAEKAQRGQAGGVPVKTQEQNEETDRRSTLTC